MLHRKTPTKNRDDYTYIDVNGTKYPIKVGEDGVTEETIKLLHSADDAEVYNNLKNHRCPNSKPQNKHAVKANSENTESIDNASNDSADSTSSRWNIPIEQIMDGDENFDGLGDKSSILADISYSIDEDESPAVERLRAIISSMPQNWKEIYQAVAIEEIPMTRVALSRGVSEGAIRKIFEKIKKKLLNDDALKKIYQ